MKSGLFCSHGNLDWGQETFSIRVLRLQNRPCEKESTEYENQTKVTKQSCMIISFYQLGIMSVSALFVFQYMLYTRMKEKSSQLWQTDYISYL